MPVALNCRFVPTAIEGVAGVTAIDLSTPLLTVIIRLPGTGCPVVEGAVLVAVMTAVPVPFAVTSPADAATFDTVATPVLSEPQVTIFVRSTVGPAVNVPVAVSCSVAPFSIVVDIAAVMAIDCRTASDTVSVAVPVTFTPPGGVNDAVMTLVPLATGVTFPGFAAFEIVATVVVAESQWTVAVRSCFDPSE